MPLTTGTHDLASLLLNKQTTVATFGLENIAPIFAAELAAHNAQITEILGDLAETSDDRLRLSGAGGGMKWIDSDEYSRAPTQKSAPGATVGFPLRLRTIAVDWTQEWFELHSPADMAIMVKEAEDSHIDKVRVDIQRALFQSANYTSFDRHAAPQVDIAVKRLLNADGMAIPRGPNGETFDAATHTHYLASTTLTAAAVTSAINTVVEHGHGAGVRVVINRTDETAFKALVGFEPYTHPALIQGPGDTSTTLDITRLDNRAIGLFGAAEVHVKSWGIANYMLVYAAGDSRKPLVRRVRTGDDGGMKIAAEIDMFPLHAKYMRSLYGFGVWTRTAAAVLYFAGGAYVDPTITY